MKLNWSILTTLLFSLGLAGCGAEQFGSTPQSQSNQVAGPQQLESNSCSTYTLIKPKVDILYVVDNSYSTVYLGPAIKNSIKKTVETISQQFDYRVIGTKLISDSFTDYQVMTNSSDLAGEAGSGRLITSSEQFDFFSHYSDEKERGLHRIHSFMNYHKNGLFRKGAYHLVILISNGSDQDVELSYPYPTNIQGGIYCVGNPDLAVPSCPVGQSVFDQRKSSFNSLRTALESQQFRLFAVTTPQQSCTKQGWKKSEHSYRKMAQQLYRDSGATDSPIPVGRPDLGEDRHDLCDNSSLQNLFTPVNNSIQQVVINHVYKYWPITFADSSTASIDPSDMQVIKYLPNGTQQVLTHGTQWIVTPNPNYPGPLNTRVEPTPGEPASTKYFVEFKSGHYLTHPACVLIKSNTKKEFFNWIVLNKKPVESSIMVKINGINVPKSSTNGWSYSDAGQPMVQNIKCTDSSHPGEPHTNANNEPILKSGFMIKLNGMHYESGDQVDLYYLPAAL